MDYEHFFFGCIFLGKAILGRRLKQNDVVVLNHLPLLDIFTVPTLFQ